MKVRQKYLLFLLISVFLLGACNTEKVIPKASIPPESIAVPTELKIMFYTTELETEITLIVGEKVELWACAYDRAEKVNDSDVVWSSSDEASIAVTQLDNSSVTVAALKASGEPVKITASCMGIEKELYVHTVTEILN